MKRPYNATTRNGSVIVSVQADNFEDAERQIIQELYTPERTDVLESWKAQGKFIELECRDMDDPAVIEVCNMMLRHLKVAGQ